METAPTLESSEREPRSRGTRVVRVDEVERLHIAQEAKVERQLGEEVTIARALLEVAGHCTRDGHKDESIDESTCGRRSRRYEVHV